MSQVMERIEGRTAVVGVIGQGYVGLPLGLVFADLGLRSVPLEPEVLAGYDAVVLATAHDAFRDGRLYRGARIVVDTRNLVAAALGPGAGDRPRIWKA